ncbi:unnamed protein product [Cuscuta campestris]|uniref:Uncharacterized protein n=1 Tax=Cuscuta campestris TaxID=132261 RepID=A0A484K7W8_9ASTE|nr:unnamed protein product [Cuscuta campestris]
MECNVRDCGEGKVGRFGGVVIVRGYIDGTTRASSADDAEWYQFDALIQGWILATITDEVSDLVLANNLTAHALWTAIYNLFHDNKHARAMQLEHRFRTTVKGQLSINEYCRLLKNLSEYLDDVDAPVTEHALVLQKEERKLLLRIQEGSEEIERLRGRVQELENSEFKLKECLEEMNKEMGERDEMLSLMGSTDISSCEIEGGIGKVSVSDSERMDFGFGAEEFFSRSANSMEEVHSAYGGPKLFSSASNFWPERASPWQSRIECQFQCNYRSSQKWQVVAPTQEQVRNPILENLRGLNLNLLPAGRNPITLEMIIVNQELIVGDNHRMSEETLSFRHFFLPSCLEPGLSILVAPIFFVAIEIPRRRAVVFRSP